jgi:hypothetical protein
MYYLGAGGERSFVEFTECSHASLNSDLPRSWRTMT